MFLAYVRYYHYYYGNGQTRTVKLNAKSQFYKVTKLQGRIDPLFSGDVLVTEIQRLNEHFLCSVDTHVHKMCLKL